MLSPAPAAQASVERDFARTIDELRGILDSPVPITAKCRDHAHTLLDRAQVMAGPFMTPKVNDDWAQFGLTTQETRLLGLLIAKPGEPVRRESMMNALYFDRCGEEPAGKIIDVWVCKIKRKFGCTCQSITSDSKNKGASRPVHVCGATHHIRNVWSVGYLYSN